MVQGGLWVLPAHSSMALLGALNTVCSLALSLAARTFAWWKPLTIVLVLRNPTSRLPCPAIL